MSIRIKTLKYNNQVYREPSEITEILSKYKLFWLDDAEIENAIIEIKDGKLYWYQGIWYFGTWQYGIWLDGIFKYGTWESGVWYNGLWLNGIWESGVWMNGEFRSGTFESGDFRNGTKDNAVKFLEQEQEQISENKIIKFGSYK